MDKEFVLDALRRNWYLLAALVVLPIFGWTLMGDGEDGTGGSTLRADAATVDSASSGRTFSNGPFKARMTSRDEALASIGDYEAFNKANPDHPDVPRNLERMGNLYYSALQNYEMAINKFELLLLRYPSYPDIHEMYPSLAACYERTQRWELARETYRRMLDYYSPDSQYYAFAEAKLSGKL